MLTGGFLTTTQGLHITDGHSVVFGRVKEVSMIEIKGLDFDALYHPETVLLAAMAESGTALKEVLCIVVV